MRAFRLLPPLALLAGCAAVPPVATPVAFTPPPAAAPAPFAGYPGVRVPPRLADGSYATPNHAVSAAAAVWHLRAGLNVAALSCRDADEAALAAGYNALLAAHRDEFAAAYRALSTQHGTAAALDGAMTGLYNYYALPPAQPALCQAARSVIADAALIPAGGLGQFAPAALQRLDAPFVTVFAAQDAWLAARAAAPAAPAVTTIAAVGPRLVADRSVLTLP